MRINKLDSKPTPYPSSTRVELGFTLVELLMIIVIIGTLSAIVGPRFFDQDTFDDRFAYEDVKAAFRYAQRYAVTSGCYASAYYTAGNLTLDRDDDCDRSNGYCFTSAIFDANNATDYDRAIDATVAPATVRVVFTPEGFARNTNSVAGCITDANLTEIPATTFTMSVGGTNIEIDYSTGFVR